MKKRQGESIRIKCTSDIPLSSYENVRVVVYRSKKDIITKAAMVSVAGYDTDLFELDPIDDEVFYVQVLETSTASAKAGMYWIEAETKLPDANWKTEFFNGKSAVAIFELEESPQ